MAVVETERHGQIFVVRLNRPERLNALGFEIRSLLADAWSEFRESSDLEVGVFTGAGRAFCAGGDVKRFAAVSSGGQKTVAFEDRVHDLRSRMEVSRLLHEMPKPTLAVIPGPAAGAGLSLALACDLRIAAKDAKLTTAFSKVGLSGDFGGSYFLTYLVGVAKARELYFTGRVLLGQEALELGIVNRVATADHLEQEANSYAAELAALPTLAVGYMKKNLNAALKGSLGDVLDCEAIHMIRTFETEDHKQAAQAFLEKRAPEFSGQ